MDPIPIWLRRRWDAWDLRILVLLSFVLQVILAIFGSRRKYISSLWINVFVWLAYLMADWVATVALGKLSDAEGDQGSSNELWAIWAPLLLLHLGGPDTITAYSLEDNQLWMRHLMGLVVQTFVVVYVMLMSWKNSWFSFMSLPALVAGVAKYGERTRVLKSVSDNEYQDNVPVGDLRDIYPTGDHEYVDALVIAHKHLKDFTGYLDDQSRASLIFDSLDQKPKRKIVRDAVEVKVGLMYDLLYTKATKVYREGGCILRLISFVCTVVVLVGLIIQIAYFNLRKEDNEIDIAITWVLLVGALALEFYATIVIFSSNWMMLWLIKSRRRDWVIWLSDWFPWLFNKGKNWTGKMGQFDLIEYWLKFDNKETVVLEEDEETGVLGEEDEESEEGEETGVVEEIEEREENGEVEHPSRKRCSITKCRERIMLVLGSKFVRKIIRFGLGSGFEEKMKRYLHKTTVPVSPCVYKGILDLLRRKKIADVSDDEYINNKAKEIWELVYPASHGGGIKLRIMFMHLTTKLCYQKEKKMVPSGSNSSWKENMEVSKALSNYMMYLFAMQPSLLPNIGSISADKHIKDARYINGARDVDEACDRLIKKGRRRQWSKAARGLLKNVEKSKRWEIIKLIWVRMLRSAATEIEGYRQKDGHFQQLRQGGELLTFVWFYCIPRIKEDDD